VKRLAFGSLAFDRSSIPEQLRDWVAWAAVDQSSLSPDHLKMYLAREAAFRSFRDSPELSISEICHLSGISPSSLYRFFERCCEKHPDGRIYGFRALLPYVRIEKYNRTQPMQKGVADGRAGRSGAFGMLLARYPNIKGLLVREARDRIAKVDGVREIRKSLKKIHKKFLDACRKERIGADEYPFNQDHLGIRSLATHLKTLANESFEMAARTAGARRVGAPFPTAGTEKPDPALCAFEVVEFDGHQIDLRLTLKISDPFGLETRLELSRIWILVLIEVASRAALGYALALGRQYNKDDVAEALQAALAPHTSREIKIPGLAIREGGGFPSSVIPETQYACWEWFRFDNARSHLAQDTLDRLTGVVGCWPDAGAPGDPNSRPFIERFFSLLAQNFAHRIVGTTGSDPNDIVRQLADPGAKAELLMTLDELEDLVEVLLADYNGETGPSGRTPLQALAHLVSKRGGFIRTIPKDQRGKLCLIQEARTVTIRGSLRDGNRPHINFEHVRYSSDVLSNNPALIGRKLKIYFKPRDIRTLHAFFEEGAELGILTAAKPWCYTPHSLRVRQEIFRLKMLGKLKYKEGDDPVEAWVKYKRAQARTSKAAVNDLAKARDAMIPREERAADHPPAEPAPRAQSPDSSPPRPKVLKLKRTLTF